RNNFYIIPPVWLRFHECLRDSHVIGDEGESRKSFRDIAHKRIEPAGHEAEGDTRFLCRGPKPIRWMSCQRIERHRRTYAKKTRPIPPIDDNLFLGWVVQIDSDADYTKAV